ncbi:MAG TPA: mechanosensitive ion channel domain-containing protein [Candidatus Limnocylindria bacterium]|nr:mechanosensitive ion channel domain-containing protein [Candidatus Limnocylindria bacterium]
MNTEDVVGFLEANWLALIFWSGLALVVFRLIRPVVDRIGERIIRARQAQGIDPAELNELRKRLATVEDLVARLLRAAVLFVIVVVVLTLLDLVSVIVALGVVFAGLAIAGQSIILDYLMGILILVEGQFYVGDWITIATGNVTVSGTVEEIGLRRTILRDVSGTVHSVSNGEVRVSSNLTRVYAVLQVEIPLMGEADLEQAIAITNRVGAEMYADPEWSTRLLEAPAYASIPTVSDLGITLRAAGRVQGQDRFTAASELRRRLLTAYAAEGIGLAQRLRPPAA